MRNTAVMHQVRKFGKIQFVIQNQFFCFFNFVVYDIMFNGYAFRCRKKIGKISIVMMEFFAGVHRYICFWEAH